MRQPWPAKIFEKIFYVGIVHKSWVFVQLSRISLPTPIKMMLFTVLYAKKTLSPEHIQRQRRGLILEKKRKSYCGGWLGFSRLHDKRQNEKDGWRAKQPPTKPQLCPFKCNNLFGSHPHWNDQQKRQLSPTSICHHHRLPSPKLARRSWPLFLPQQ